MKTEQNDMYNVQVRCTNCGYPNIMVGETYFITIKKGTKAVDFLKEFPCCKCGCNTLELLK